MLLARTRHLRDKLFRCLPSLLNDPLTLSSPCASAVCVTKSNAADTEQRSLQCQGFSSAFLARSFAVTAVSTADASKRNGSQEASVREVNAILEHIAVQNLRVSLESQAESRQTLSVQEMVNLIKEHGIASSEEEALKVIDAMHISGLILKFKTQVYLNPEEVAELVIRALPDTVQEVEARVREIEQQLQPMEKQLREIDNHAHWRSRIVAYGGFALLVGQIMLFARLTYWELSWDVMEPVSYFTGQLTVLAMYVYYLYTRRDFTYQDHFGSLITNNRQKMLAKKKFDFARYEKLQRDHHRWLRYLQQAAKR